MSETTGSTYPFPLADELRFLAAQCEAQAKSAHGEDRAFLHRLAAQLFEIGGCRVIDFIAGMIADAATALDAGQTTKDVIRARARALREAASQFEAEGRAA